MFSTSDMKGGVFKTGVHKMDFNSEQHSLRL